jgi:hypothetical protein
LENDRINNPEVQNSILEKNLTRREVLKALGLTAIGSAILLGSPSLLTGCSANAEVSKERNKIIRKESGKWSKEEVIQLANEMINEDKYSLISFSGSVLLMNQRNEARTLSYISPLFTDDELKFSTKEKVDGMSALATEINEVGEYEVRLKSKFDNLAIDYLLPTSLQLKEIVISHKDTKNLSDFFLNFQTAEKIYGIYAIDLATEFGFETKFSKLFEIPDDPQALKAIYCSLYSMDLNDVPTSFISDVWSKFLMVPTYRQAVENGKFSSNDTESRFLEPYRRAFSIFQSKGILKKNSENGTYKYDWENGALFSWLEMTDDFYRESKAKIQS